MTRAATPTMNSPRRKKVPAVAPTVVAPCPPPGGRHRVLVMAHGRVLVEGSPDAVRADPRVVEAYLGGAPA